MNYRKHKDGKTMVLAMGMEGSIRDLQERGYLPTNFDSSQYNAFERVKLAREQAEKTN